MKKIKLGFVDKWTGFVPEEDYYYKVLARHYEIELSDKPDYLICSLNGRRHIYFTDCVKIFACGENVCPDFNEYDYAVAFDFMEFGDRYLRMPLYAVYEDYQKLSKRRETMPSDEELLNRKFCSFVVSNGGYGNPLRRQFFERLSKYKQVDSGGRFMNNVGGRIKNKAEFIRGYKFNIAFENSSSPGYTTEKVMQPLAEHVVPIYWGNPQVERDFRPESMVVVKNEADVERAIEEIIYLDTHDDAYLAKAKADCLAQPFDYYDQRLEAFLCHIIDQPLAEAKRLNKYGFQTIRRARMRRIYKLEDALKAPFKVIRKVRKCLRFDV